MFSAIYTEFQMLQKYQFMPTTEVAVWTAAQFR